MVDNFSDESVVLRVSNLRKTYGARKVASSGKGVRAVDDISFDIRSGEVVGLVGESGSGKSTTARIVAGLNRADSGSVEIGGTNLADISGKRLHAMRRRVQMTFQDPYSSLDPRWQIGRSIAEPLVELTELKHDAKARRRRVDELLAMVELSPTFYKRFPNDLSGGQRQRVGIARAIAVNPSLVVLDEPLSSLDVSVQASLINLLNDLRVQTKTAYLFIAHDLAVVRYFSDRVLVMHDGRIVERGDTDSIFDRPQDAYTRSLLASIPSPRWAAVEATDES